MSTTKYSPVSFVPKSLLEFFAIVANQYFLLVSALQVRAPRVAQGRRGPWGSAGNAHPSPHQIFTSLNPESNKVTTIGPLMFVFAVTLVKQGIEDYRRHLADKEMNRREVVVSVCMCVCARALPLTSLRAGAAGPWHGARELAGRARGRHCGRGEQR